MRSDLIERDVDVLPDVWGESSGPSDVAVEEMFGLARLDQIDRVLRGAILVWSGRSLFFHVAFDEPVRLEVQHQEATIWARCVHPCHDLLHGYS